MPPADHPVRVAADLYASATTEGARQSRSTKQQLDHWARVGRGVTSQHLASVERIRAALSGELPVGRLTVEESVVFDAEISAGIQERLAVTDYGRILAAHGVRTVAVGDDGQISVIDG